MNELETLSNKIDKLTIDNKKATERIKVLEEKIEWLDKVICGIEAEIGKKIQIKV